MESWVGSRAFVNLHWCHLAHLALLSLSPPFDTTGIADCWRHGGGGRWGGKIKCWGVAGGGGGGGGVEGGKDTLFLHIFGLHIVS